MDPEEKVEICGTEHTIPVRPITVIVKGSQVSEDIKYKDRIALDMPMSLYHMDRTQTFHADIGKYIEMVFPNYKEEITPCNIRKEGLGMRHFAGRMDMTLKFLDMKVPFAWVYPEAGLHPGCQGALADILIGLRCVLAADSEPSA